MNMQAKEIEAALRLYSNPEKQEIFPRFFKTGKGEYGEGDRFLGVVVPDTRKVARAGKEASPETVAELLQSPWHECRLCALLILVERFKKCDEKGKKEIFDFYLSHTEHINNWDLVDLSAPAIVGEYLLHRPEERSVLYRLADSSLLWDNRIAVVSTLTFIKNRDFIDIIQLSAHYLHTPEKGFSYTFHTPSVHFSYKKLHDLMQKAIGWMLREMGKRDKALLEQFLEEHVGQMPRTMLRYAIEKFPEHERRDWMER